MQAQQRRNRCRIAAAEAAFGGNGKIANVLLSCAKPRPRTIDAVRVVDETETELCTQLEPPQRREIGVVGTIARHRHMNELYWPRDLPRYAVGKLDHVAHIGRLDDVTVAG